MDWPGCIASLVLLAVPAVGSVYPVPAPPVNYFPYAFLIYLAVGIAWILAFYQAATPTASTKIRQDLDETHARYESVGMAAGE